MKDYQRNYHVANINAGQYRCEVGGQHFLVKSASLIQLADAESIFMETLKEAEFNGAYSTEELFQYLNDSGIFTEENASDMKQLEKNIEDQKVGLFENSVRSDVREIIRLSLATARKEYHRLFVLKHSHDNLSSVGIAEVAKLKYIVGCSVYYDDGSPYWSNCRDGWYSPDLFLDKILFKARMSQLSEADFRELARTDPWKTILNSSKYCGNKIFDMPASELTADQKTLISWSNLYQSVGEHPQCPDDSIINDDDILDGWLIIQNRERVKNLNKKMGEELITNNKIKNAAEIFVVTDKDSIGKVLDMNDDSARITMNARLNTVKNFGELGEHQMPDTAMKNQQAIMNAFANRVKNK